MMTSNMEEPMQWAIPQEIGPEQGQPGKGHERGFDPTGETGGGLGRAARDSGFQRTKLDGVLGRLMSPFVEQESWAK